MNNKFEKDLAKINGEIARIEKTIKEAQEHHRALLDRKTQIECEGLPG